MLLVPNSDGQPEPQPLFEVNRCHGPGRAHPCPYGPSEHKVEMSEEEADEWVKGSKYTGTVTTVIRSKNEKSLRNSGFDLSNRNVGNEWGKAVYAATDAATNAFYKELITAQNAEDPITTVRMKVRLMNPLVVDYDKTPLSQTKDLAKVIGQQKLFNQGMKEFDSLGIVVDPKALGGTRPNLKKVVKGGVLDRLGFKNRHEGEDIAKFLIRSILLSKGYDGIVFKGNPSKLGIYGRSVPLSKLPTSVKVGGNQVVVFDPKAVVILK